MRSVLPGCRNAGAGSRDYNASPSDQKPGMSEDRIFASQIAGDGPFEFNDTVAAVFPDMLRRSIPGYTETILAIGSLARRFVTENTICYDLGCSLGAATLAMRHHIACEGCRVVAIDNSDAMISRCRKIVADDDATVPVEVIAGDIRHAEIRNASMVVMNYTLQFIPVADRDAMVRKIFAGMNDRGILVLSEKVVDDDAEIEQLLVDLHHEEKKRNAYSDSEIARKRAAIQNVLIPERLDVHEARLKRSGFCHVGTWSRFFNFVSLVAIK